VTSTLVTLPDCEQLVIDALLSMPALAALGGRIYSVVPKQRTFPLARVYRYGGDPLYGGEPYWLDNPSLQIDVWEDGTVEAQRLGELLRSCCAQQLAGVWPTGVVDSVQVSALIQSPDPTFTPSKPRYRFTAQLMVHPATPAAAPLATTSAGSPRRSSRRAVPAE
jgi:hypothetical protein